MHKNLSQNLILAFMLITIYLSGQKQISGKINDSKTGDAIFGAVIKVVGANIGTTSDINGNYKLNVPDNSILEIYYTGYTTKSYDLSSANSYDFLLDESNTSLDQVIVIGTRKPGRVLMETTVPIDVVNVKQSSQNTGRMDLTSILNYSAPSMNYNKQSGSDGADHIDLATLRGLGPDQTLVLINGKRRHQTAFVAVFGTRGRGNSGTDLNAFPAAAIDRVEILRDGAAAQYGSDAIAGVINIILKRNTGWTTNLGYSSYFDKKFNPAFKSSLNQYVFENKWDGGNLSADLNYGLSLGKKGGFANFTANYITTQKTFRQVLDTSNLFANSNALPINIYRRANGDGSVNQFGLMMNLELPIKSNINFYSFGGLNIKSSDAYAFTRNFSARPERFVTDSSGAMIEKTGIIFKTSDNESYYNPHIQTRVKDYSIAVGLKGEMSNGWGWDLSNVLGRNDFHFYGDKTFNASSGDINKNHFDDGGFSFLQNTSNFSLNKQLFTKLHLGIGGELRVENYQLYSGELASYKNINPALEKASGSQGFPGYQPNDESNESRTAIGMYVDGEYDLTTNVLLNTAIRLENYSDFGFTATYKLATRVKLFNNFNLRASSSTGFRAPSLQQINFSSTFTTVQGGQISEVKIAPNQNEITKAAGIEDLTEEKSLNLNVGFTFRPVQNFSITVDAYQVKVKDRIVLSGQFSAEDTTLNTELTSKLKALNVSLAQFFANAVNTTNKGIDVVLDYNNQFGAHTFRTIYTANFQKMTIDNINVPSKLNNTEALRSNFLSSREQTFILASAPSVKQAINLEYGYKKNVIGLRLTLFGRTVIQGYGEDGLGINPVVPTDADETIKVADEYIYKAQLVTDFYYSYKLFKSGQISIGVDNLLNVHPDFGARKEAKYWAYNTETGGPWDAVQMGFNGMRIFGKIGISF